MKSTSVALGALSALLLVSCGPRTRNETGTTGGMGTAADSAAMQNRGMGAGDTMMAPGGTGRTGNMRDTGRMTDTSGTTGASDTGRSGSNRRTSDSGASNQTESGVTDSRTGRSTLGTGVRKTRPDAGEPVMSKGDTIRAGGDTVAR